MDKISRDSSIYGRGGAYDRIITPVYQRLLEERELACIWSVQLLVL